MYDDSWGIPFNSMIEILKINVPRRGGFRAFNSMIEIRPW